MHCTFWGIAQLVVQGFGHILCGIFQSIAQLVLQGCGHIAHSMFQSIAQLVVQRFGPLGVERTLGRTTTTPHLSIMDDAAGRVICIWHHHHKWHHHDFHHVQKLITSKSFTLRQSND